MTGGGVTVREIVEAWVEAINLMYRSAAEQLEAFDATMKALETIGATTWGAELLEPQERAKAPRPHPYPDAGRRRRPENARLPRTTQRASIRPQAHSTIKQRRNRRRE